jgi:hypothetical protein
MIQVLAYVIAAAVIVALAVAHKLHPEWFR